MTNFMQYRSQAADTNRLPSPAIWGRSRYDEVIQGFTDGCYFYDDFLSPYLTVPTTQGVFPPYKAFTSTGGTIDPATQVLGGVVTLGSDGDDEGASFQTINAPFQIEPTKGSFYCEARCKVDTIAVTKYDVFFGLVESATLTATVPITATAGALADKNLVGIMRPGTSTTGDGAIARATYKADGVAAVTVADLASAWAADTWAKIGMKFSTRDNYIRFYFNGVEFASKLVPSSSGTDFPSDTLMAPTLAVLNTAAVTSLFSVDWIRFLQVYDV